MRVVAVFFYRYKSWLYIYIQPTVRMINNTDVTREQFSMNKYLLMEYKRIFEIRYGNMHIVLFFWNVRIILISFVHRFFS